MAQNQTSSVPWTNLDWLKVKFWSTAWRLVVHKQLISSVVGMIPTFQYEFVTYNIGGTVLEVTLLQCHSRLWIKAYMENSSDHLCIQLCWLLWPENFFAMGSKMYEKIDLARIYPATHTHTIDVAYHITFKLLQETSDGTTGYPDTGQTITVLTVTSSPTGLWSSMKMHVGWYKEVKMNVYRNGKLSYFEKMYYLTLTEHSCCPITALPLWNMQF